MSTLRWWWLASLALAACGGESGAPPTAHAKPDAGTPDAGAGCAPGRTLGPAGQCCDAGSRPTDDGGCEPAGIAPEACGAGFAATDDRACRPVLPSPECPKGSLGQLGDVACHPIAACGIGKWGDAPIDATTQFVDAAYAGGDGDGTEAKPWTTIDGAVDAAAPGATIAIAAGSYDAVVLAGKPVALWGACPELVEIAGMASTSALEIRAGASGSEIHRVAVHGSWIGVTALGSTGVLLDEVWIRDAPKGGLWAVNTPGPTSVTLRRALVESDADLGVGIIGADVTIEDSVIRDIATDASGKYGRGVQVAPDAPSGARGRLTMRRSLVRHTRDEAVYAVGSDLVIESSAIDDTMTTPTGHFGMAIALGPDTTTAARSTLTLRASWIANSFTAGVFVTGSDAAIEDSVVSDTSPEPAAADLGEGVWSDPAEVDAGRSVVTIRRSVFKRNTVAAVAFEAADFTIESTILRDTRPRPPGPGEGDGYGVAVEEWAGEGSTLALRWSVVDANRGAGVTVSNGDLDIEGCVVRGTLARPDGRFGRGIQVQGVEGRRATASVKGSLVEDNNEMGVLAYDGDLTLDGTIVRGTRADAMIFGDGVGIFALHATATARVTGVVSASNARAGLVTFGGAVELGSTTLDCNAVAIDGEQTDVSSYSLVDLGGNVCGCGDVEETCAVLSAGLSAPPPQD